MAAVSFPHAGAHHALAVGGLVLERRPQQVLQDLLRTAPDPDELVDQVEVLDHEACLGLLHCDAPCEGFTMPFVGAERRAT